MKGDRLVVLAGALVTTSVFWVADERFWAFVSLGVGLFLAGRGVRRDRAFSVEQRRQLLERDRQARTAVDVGFCAYCMRPVHYGRDCPFGGCGRDYEADHVDAFSTGGATTLENGVVSCRRCNRWKGARPVAEFLEDPDGDGVPGV